MTRFFLTRYSTRSSRGSTTWEEMNVVESGALCRGRDDEVYDKAAVADWRPLELELELESCVDVAVRGAYELPADLGSCAPVRGTILEETVEKLIDKCIGTVDECDVAEMFVELLGRPKESQWLGSDDIRPRGTWLRSQGEAPRRSVRESISKE